MKKLLLTLGLMTGIVIAAPVEPYNGAGAYINVNSGWGTLQNLPTGSLVFAANAGYNFNRALAVEGGWTNLTSAQYGATAYDNFVDVAVRATLPLSKVFSFYGRLGGGVNYTTFSGVVTPGPDCLCNSNYNYNYAWLAGAGGNFVLSKHFDLRVEDFIILPIGGGNPTYGTVNSINAGLQYNF